MSKRIFAASVALLAVSACVIGADQKAEKKHEFKAVCPVSGKPAVETTAVEYKGAKVYLCCPACEAPFKKDTAKFAAKANQQLVATRQAKQVSCPFTGGELNPETAVKVGGVKVRFCCDKCQAKVTKASPEEQVQLVFNDQAFAKGFEIKKK